MEVMKPLKLKNTKRILEKILDVEDHNKWNTLNNSEPEEIVTVSGSLKAKC